MEWSGFLLLDKRDQKSPVYLLLGPESMVLLLNFTFGPNLLTTFFYSSIFYKLYCQI